MDLIKKIMMRIEDYDKQVVLNHMKMLIDADFLGGISHMNNEGGKPTVGFVHIEDITWQGYDFLELLKNDEKFAFLKDIGKKLSLEALKSAVKIATTTALT